MQEEKRILPSAAPKARKQLVKKGANDFELEDNDNWPDVDVGNLIIDLDADIDKEAMASVPMTSASPKATEAATPTMSAAASTSVPSATPVVTSTNAAAVASKLKTLVTTHCNSGGSGSATQTLTETLTATTAASAAASTSTSTPANGDKEKGLKMKIKRTKQGPRHPEGKLEIVPNKPSSGSSLGATGGSSSPREGSPVPNGSFMPCDPALMSAADIVAAAKAAAVKHGGPKAVGGNKVRLSSNNSDNNGSSSSKKVAKSPAPAPQPQNGDLGKVSSNNKVNSKSKVDGSSAAAAAAAGGGGPPAAKRQKVDASVGTEIGTMTEPECLGPLDPGTSVTLEGIVWNETDGVLVINVTWRGKTYVGTLLDSTRHVNQWAPPRYSESPTSELESRTPKGRGAKRGRGSAGTPVETETRKNLRSSKSKSRGGSAGINSPAKRKGRGSDGDEKSGDENKRKRTDSSRNSPGDEDDDSEKEAKGNESDKDSATSSVKGKDDKDDLFMLPKDKEEEKYIPPPPLPYALVCPKSDCKKRYRQHNGLRFHVSHAHPELLDDVGNIRDTSEIERLEKEAKDRLPKEASNGDNGSTDSHSGSSSKTSTPGPNEVSNSNSASTDSSSISVPISVPLPPSSGLKVPGPPLDAKPIPVSAIEGGIPANARPPAPVLQTTAMSLPIVPRAPPQAHVKPIRPPVNARPIVPATGPQIMHGGGLGPSAINLKPIQPRPTIMPDPTPNLALDDLKKAKKHKKASGSPGTSPPRAASLNGSSPKIHPNQPSISEANNTVPPSAKSPAYSDISDDESDRKRASANVPISQPPTSNMGLPFGLPPTASLPTVPVSPQQAAAVAKEKKELVTGPQPGTIEYEKMLLAYGFPPFPYPIPPGMDPGMHVHMLTTDPVYKNKYEKDRAEKEKAFKEQIDRDNREKDRKAGVKLPPSEDLASATAAASSNIEHKKTMISVKPEFRDNNHTKKEPHQQQHRQQQHEYHPKKVEDEGMKATMETRGPPPATPTSYAGLMHPALMGRPPFYDPGLLAAGIPPHLLASLYGSNPYLHPGFGGPGSMRPPFMPVSASGSSPEDLSRSAALAMAAVTSLAGGNSATKALDLLQQHANQYYAAAVAASAAATMTSSSSSSPSSHKIHELQERALKSPGGMHGRGSGTSSPNVTARSTPSSSFNTVTTTSTTTKTSDFASSRKGTPSPRTTTPTGSRSRSPPPLRHVHTHTHTHFGLGYPLLPPPSGVPGVAPPAAHTPFPPAGFPSHLLPGKPSIPGALPNFPPPK